MSIYIIPNNVNLVDMSFSRDLFGPMQPAGNVYNIDALYYFDDNNGGTFVTGRTPETAGKAVKELGCKVCGLLEVLTRRAPKFTEFKFRLFWRFSFNAPNTQSPC